MTTDLSRGQIRSAGRNARQSLRGQRRDQAEARLIDHLGSLAAMRRPSVGVFIAHDGEPNLQPLVEACWRRGQQVALPVLSDDPSDFSMTFVPWKPDDPLSTGRYGIPVPAPATAIVPETLLVSLTGFDHRGNRIGRGGGFFDRYLENFCGQVVGVGFESQRFPKIPVEPHDQSLPTMATDLGVRFFAAAQRRPQGQNEHRSV